MVHPSEDILFEESRVLEERKIVLGVTSSIALYRSIDLARKFMRRGARVRVVMSPEASRFISPLLFEWATGVKPVTEISGEVEHILLAREYDGMVIAPATANTIAKIAYGIADTPVTLTALSFHGKGKPVLIVPVMHLNMYYSRVVRENIERLKQLGYYVLEPLIEEDKAKIPPIEEIALKMEALVLRGEDLRGVRVLVTAGPTREYLDPIRFLSNPSSGRMGVAVAREAFYRGARVRLIHGPLCGIEPPFWIDRVGVTSTEEMRNKVLEEVEKSEYDIVVLAAAPADYKFKKTSPTKIDSSSKLIVELEPTPKIIRDVARVAKTKKPSTIIIGFAAETARDDRELIERARRKMEKYGIDMIVANNVARKDIGFTSKYNEVYIITRDRVEHIPKKTKEEVARIILDKAIELTRK